MRYAIETIDRIYIKGYGFLSFAKNTGAHATKFDKNLSDKFLIQLKNLRQMQ